VTSLVIHGHFYQPPREDPWTGQVEREPSAHPAHDWNERVHQECYRPNAFARVLDGYGRIESIANNYAWLSFNFGPTLLSWLELHDPVVYARILEADRHSAARLGHGNAIAQGYNHTILPLCNDRDRRTQVRWGLADFRHRFGRDAESLWLPETACNDATLGTLIDEGLRWVILSPYQAERIRRIGDDGWTSVADGSIDPGQAYRYLHRDGSGRSIAIFFYDGPISRAIAFEGALASSQALVGRFEGAGGGEGRLVHVATDGETYGHHARHADRGLAHALLHEAPGRGFQVTNYGAFLDDHPPTHEVEIKAGPNGEGTAWSCAHGVGRWVRDCGCSTGAREGWNQAWRGPLRRAFDHLRDAAAARFEEARGDLLVDPWVARDAYLELGFGQAKDAWLRRMAGRELRRSERERALTLLEMQRHALYMYTSCGWFFADVSGIETVQVMKYAVRALDLMDELDLASPREAVLDLLAEARSNLPELGTGADVLRRFADPSRVSAGRVAVHIAITRLAEDQPENGRLAGFRYELSSFRGQKHGRLGLATGRVGLEEIATEKTHDYAFAVLHLGGVDFYCVARGFPGAHRFGVASNKLWASFRTASLATMLRLAQEELGPDEFGLDSLLPEGRRRVTQLVLGDIAGGFAQEYARLFENNRRVVEMLHEAGVELPRDIAVAIELTLGRRFEEAIRRADGSADPAAYDQAIAIAEEAERWGFALDHAGSAPTFARLVAHAVGDALAEPSPERLAAAVSLASLATRLGLAASLERGQEILFEALSSGAAGSAFHPLARELRLAVPSGGAP